MGGSGISKFQIQITSTTTIFRPGQIIRGNVTVVSKTLCEHQGLTVSCEGYVLQGGNSAARIKKKKHHLHIVTPACEGGILEPGQHTFPFNFSLPANMPSSSYVVTYKLTARMEGGRSGKKAGKILETEIKFKVHGNCKWISHRPSPDPSI